MPEQSVVEWFVKALLERCRRGADVVVGAPARGSAAPAPPDAFVSDSSVADIVAVNPVTGCAGRPVLALFVDDRSRMLAAAVVAPANPQAAGRRGAASWPTRDGRRLAARPRGAVRDMREC